MRLEDMYHIPANPCYECKDSMVNCDCSKYREYYAKVQKYRDHCKDCVCLSNCDLTDCQICIMCPALETCPYAKDPPALVTNSSKGVN